MPVVKSYFMPEPKTVPAGMVGPQLSCGYPVNPYGRRSEPQLKNLVKPFCPFMEQPNVLPVFPIADFYGMLAKFVVDEFRFGPDNLAAP